MTSLTLSLNSCSHDVPSGIPHGLYIYLFVRSFVCFSDLLTSVFSDSKPGVGELFLQRAR